MSVHGVSLFSQHVRLNYAHYPHHFPLVLSLSSLFMFDKDTRKTQFLATDLGNESEEWCVDGFFWWWNQSLLKSAFVCCLQRSLICPRTISNPEAVARSGESLLAHTCFPSDWTAAYGSCTYCSALFELEYLQLHPSLFCYRSQTLTLILKPGCCSVKIFTGRSVHNVFMHNENACEGYYSNNNKTETDCKPRLCLGMGWGESHIAALSVEYQRKSDPVTYTAQHSPWHFSSMLGWNNTMYWKVFALWKRISKW